MKKFYLKGSLIALGVLMSGCATTSSSVPDILSANLPRVQGVKTISAATEIGLEWPSYADAMGVEGFYVYRSENGETMRKIATIKDKYATHYADTRLSPETAYKYAVAAYGSDGVGEKSPSAMANTSKILESVPFAMAMYDLPGRIKLIWRPHPDLRVASYIIERRSKGSSGWGKEAQIDGRLNAEFIDYVNSKEYEYRIIVKTITGDLSRPSNVIASANNLQEF